MTDTYKAIVYVRRIFCDIKCPEDQDLSTAEQLDIIRQYLLQNRMWSTVPSSLTVTSKNRTPH